MLYVLCRYANVLCKAARVNIGGFEGGAHGIVAMATVMADATGDVMSDDHALPHRKVADVSSSLDNGARQFVAQYYRGRSLLHDLGNVGATQSAAMHLHQQFLVGNRWNGPVFYANVVIRVVGYCVHGRLQIFLWVGVWFVVSIARLAR